jgi:hypothetical protein
MKTRPIFVLSMAAFGFAAAPRAAQACAACMGDPNSDIAGAANAAVFTMLGLIASVLGLLAAFGYNLYRRSLAPAPPHAEIAGDIGEPSEGGIS